MVTPGHNHTDWPSLRMATSSLASCGCYIWTKSRVTTAWVTRTRSWSSSAMGRIGTVLPIGQRFLRPHPAAGMRVASMRRRRRCLSKTTWSTSTIPHPRRVTVPAVGDRPASGWPHCLLIALLGFGRCEIKLPACYRHSRSNFLETACWSTRTLTPRTCRWSCLTEQAPSSLDSIATRVGWLLMTIYVFTYSGSRTAGERACHRRDPLEIR